MATDTLKIKVEVADLMPSLRRFFAENDLAVIQRSAVPQLQGKPDQWSAGFDTAVEAINAAIAGGDAAMAVASSADKPVPGPF